MSLEYKRTTGGRIVRKHPRLSRKRKKWLRRHAPLGLAHDTIVTDNPSRRWGRPSFIAELGHSKCLWRNLWAIWNPGVPEWMRGYRFTVTRAWFAGQEHRLPKRIRAGIRRPRR